MSLCLVLALAALARADATPVAPAGAQIIFAQDPLCDTSIDFKKEFDQVRPLHLKHPEFRGTVNDQNKWFSAVTGEMKSSCEADALFALAIVKKDRSELTGQCKPAAEAAQVDQEVLEHSEASLKRLASKREEFLSTGVRGGPDSLPVVFDRDRRLVNELSLNEWAVNFNIVCELKWLYPSPLLKKVPPTSSCPDPEFFTKPAPNDKKEPALFSQLLTRFALSITYNTQRRNNARASAAASRARYNACIAEHPEEAKLKKLETTHALGSGKNTIPTGTDSLTGSDITGTKEDQEKRNKATPDSP